MHMDSFTSIGDGIAQVYDMSQPHAAIGVTSVTENPQSLCCYIGLGRAQLMQSNHSVRLECEATSGPSNFRGIKYKNKHTT